MEFAKDGDFEVRFQLTLQIPIEVFMRSGRFQLLQANSLAQGVAQEIQRSCTSKP
jgi:hypothetical protein